MAQEVTATEQQFTTGFRLLTMADVDARTNRSARQVRAVARALSNDLGNDLPIAQRMLVQRCAVLASLCQHNEVALLSGTAVSVPDYVSMVATLSRLLRTLGLQRVPKTINTLGDLLREDIEAQRLARAREATQSEQEVQDG